MAYKRATNGNRTEEIVIFRLRIGHTSVNHSLWRIDKHQTEACYHCDHPETVKHVLLECNQYAEEQKLLNSVVTRGKKREKVIREKIFSVITLIGDVSKNIRKEMLQFSFKRYLRMHTHVVCMYKPPNSCT